MSHFYLGTFLQCSCFQIPVLTCMVEIFRDTRNSGTVSNTLQEQGVLQASGSVYRSFLLKCHECIHGYFPCWSLRKKWVWAVSAVDAQWSWGLGLLSVVRGSNTSSSAALQPPHTTTWLDKPAWSSFRDTQRGSQRLNIWAESCWWLLRAAKWLGEVPGSQSSHPVATSLSAGSLGRGLPPTPLAQPIVCTRHTRETEDLLPSSKRSLGIPMTHFTKALQQQNS